jgi:hypothetical protein
VFAAFAKGLIDMWNRIRVVANLFGFAWVWFGVLVATNANADAGAYARVEIYRVSILAVCGTPMYTSPSACKEFSADDFRKLQKSRHLLSIYQTDKITPSVGNLFIDGLVRDSRVYDRYGGPRTDAVLVVVQWYRGDPKRIEVTRLGYDGRDLSADGPFNRRLRPGRFFYHFPFEQAGRVILSLEAALPSYQISYSP